MRRIQRGAKGESAPMPRTEDHFKAPLGFHVPVSPVCESGTLRKGGARVSRGLRVRSVNPNQAARRIAERKQGGTAGYTRP
jgi:hypothetical protein